MRDHFTDFCPHPGFIFTHFFLTFHFFLGGRKQKLSQLKPPQLLVFFFRLRVLKKGRCFKKGVFSSVKKGEFLGALSCFFFFSFWGNFTLFIKVAFFWAKFWGIFCCVLGAFQFFFHQEISGKGFFFS